MFGIEILVKPVFSLVGGLVTHLLKRPHLKLDCGWRHEPNGNGIGNFLALAIKIINPGHESIFFEQIEATDNDGKTFYPLFFLIPRGSEVAPQRNLVGLIPCGHIRHKGIQEIRVIDATDNVYVLKGKKLRTAVEGLLSEMSRLESLGFTIHPTSPHLD
ncbi:hypothetical protein [Methylomonas methanica]|uniref:Uncharacterized protein n=1 Tax=Methylomonas methanica TaxID=421 RepID=A0A177MKE4_METMH|nr:hypothetical protein [Methylomonas methanica]OAI06268.1 hypothetical protein A1332_11650 [Methylomonas methanica]OAI06357.1 hypothetical protein A1353_09020 [Methylomonas methanica]